MYLYAIKGILYAIKGILIPGTLVCRIMQFGHSPIDCLLNKIYKEKVSPESWVVGSLKTLVMYEHFIKSYSEEHILASLLIEAFSEFLIVKFQHVVLYPMLYG